MSALVGLQTLSPLNRSGGAVPIAVPRRTVMQVTWSLVAGGAEMYALKIASHLSKRRYRTAMCAIDQGGALEPEIRRQGTPYWIMHRPPGVQFSLMWRMYRLFRRMKVDVVQTHHFNQLFYSALGAILCGARLIHTEHSVEVYKRRKLRIALRLLSLLCDKVIVIGMDGLEVLRDRVGIPQRKLQVIRAGVDVEAYQQPREAARQALGLSADERVVVIVARLFPEKNHHLLLDAFSYLAADLPQARLLIVGDGVEEPAIAARIDRLHLCGQVRMLGVRRDIPQILAASDLFVLCSDREGLPIAVLEAMAAGLPVVATAVGDLPTVIQEGVTGHLVPPRSPSALAQAITDLLAHPSQAAAMGNHGRQFVRRQFGMEAMIARYQALFG